MLITQEVICQSCGMPIIKDREKGGTNQDGTKSVLYCSHCFKAGQFTDPDITADEMVQKVKDKLKDKNIPLFIATIFTKVIPHLKRWQK
jgi:hypothetical protein